MDPKHKTLKRHDDGPDGSENDNSVTQETGELPPVLMANAGAGGAGGASVPGQLPTHVDRFKNLLDESAKQAFARQWHRLERGLRLNRLRLYVEEMTPRCSFNEDEKTRFFNFLQNALDRKLLNTNKIVNYVPEEQKIISIRGLEVKRNVDGTIRWEFTIKKSKINNQTRRKKTPIPTPTT